MGRYTSILFIICLIAFAQCGPKAVLKTVAKKCMDGNNVPSAAQGVVNGAIDKLPLSRVRRLGVLAKAACDTAVSSACSAGGVPGPVCNCFKKDLSAKCQSYISRRNLGKKNKGKKNKKAAKKGKKGKKAKKGKKVRVLGKKNKGGKKNKAAKKGKKSKKGKKVRVLGKKNKKGGKKNKAAKKAKKAAKKGKKVRVLGKKGKKGGKKNKAAKKGKKGKKAKKGKKLARR